MEFKLADRSQVDNQNPAGRKFFNTSATRFLRDDNGAPPIPTCHHVVQGGGANQSKLWLGRPSMPGMDKSQSMVKHEPSPQTNPLSGSKI
jgi:hypothetical protein